MASSTAPAPTRDDDAGARAACRMCGSHALSPAGKVAGHAFVECARCRFTFAPHITQAWLDALYASGYHGPEEGAPEHGWEGGIGFLAPALARLGAGPHRILDFGAGQSRTPERLRARGHRVVAVDLAPPLRAHPDRLTGSILELDLPTASFDLAYSYQVFEHLPEPRPHLDRLLALTRPGGFVLVHTDMEMPERDRDGFEGWWYVLPPDHNAFFRHQTFDVALEGTPHEVVWRDPKRVLIARGDDALNAPGRGPS